MAAILEPAALRQRNVQAKSTVHDGSNSSSDSDSGDSDVSTFTPPSFTVKDLLGEFRRSTIMSLVTAATTVYQNFDMARTGPDGWKRGSGS